jgi:GT2 family glycosyltransferase
VAFVKKNFPKIPVKVAVPDKGVTYMYNEGFQFGLKRWPKAKYFVLAANDLIFKEKDWLKKLVEAAEADPKIGMVCCKLRYPNGKVQSGGIEVTPIGSVLVTDKKKSSVSRYVDVMPTALSMISRKALLDCGGNDEIIVPFNWEDIDLSSRLRSLGYRLYYVANTKVTHLESYGVFTQKVKKKWSRDEIEFTMRRNGFIYYLRWNRPLLPFYFVTDVVSNFIAIGGGIRIRKNIPYRIKTQIPAIREALKLYKTTKLRKFKE